MNLIPLLPELTLFCGALLILMLDVFLSKKVRFFFYISHILCLVISSLAVFFSVKNFLPKEVSSDKFLNTEAFNSFIKSIAILLLIFITLLSIRFVATIKKYSAEFLALILIATFGGLIMISSKNFLIFYLGLEIQALSSYLLASFNYKSLRSSEAGMKYFILGSLASGMLLFGITLVYGYTGSIEFETIRNFFISNPSKEIPVAIIFGLILIISAMFFKTSTAPFHMWTPDVYQGSPTIVSAFFATVIKFTAIIAFINLLGNIGWKGCSYLIAIIALLSISIGSFGAIFQKNLKRLLAYSSVGHVGFMMLAISNFSKQSDVACIFYLIIYTLISIGTFGFLTILKSKSNIESDEEDKKTFSINSLSGLSKTNPVMAFSIATLMFSTAGIPPLAGFFSKFYVLTYAISNNLLKFAIIAIILSVISSFYYLRIVKIMYFDKPSENIELEDYGNAKLIIFLSAIINIFMIFFMKGIINHIGNFINL